MNGGQGCGGLPATRPRPTSPRGLTLTGVKVNACGVPRPSEGANIGGGLDIRTVLSGMSRHHGSRPNAHPAAAAALTLTDVNLNARKRPEVAIQARRRGMMAGGMRHHVIPRTALTLTGINLNARWHGSRKPSEIAGQAHRHGATSGGSLRRLTPLPALTLMGVDLNSRGTGRRGGTGRGFVRAGARTAQISTHCQPRCSSDPGAPLPFTSFQIRKSAL